LRVTELNEESISAIIDTMEKDLTQEAIIALEIKGNAVDGNLVIQIELPDSTYEASYPAENVLGSDSEEVGHAIINNFLEEEES
jgi:hypothetical protein